MELIEYQDWADYTDMCTNIEGYENIPYEQKRSMAKSEVIQYISDCKEIQDVRQKIDKEPDVQESGRLYLEWAVINTFKEKVWWTTRED